ncbi:KilA-N domain-containing protein [Acinetobacter baumannii]|nr:KilA-N domain-containing protein [Acinetobacter baumannii]
MTSLTQNFLNPNNKPFVIGDFTIRQDEDGRFCINDLHKASGNDQKHFPAYFLRNQQTKDLINLIELENYDVQICISKKQAVNSVKGKGKEQGTYVVKELVYAYAMWISAEFHLMVIRAYDSMVARLFTENSKQTLIEDKTTKEDRVPLKDAVNMLVAKSKSLTYSDAYKLVHQKFGIKHVDELTMDLVPVAVEYVHKLMGEYLPKVEYIDPELKAFELLAADTTNQIHDWIWSLQDEIKRLKGNIPDFPIFDREAITRAVVSRMTSMSRMLLTIDSLTNKPHIQFIPNNSWILNDENIARIVGDREGPNKEVLPDIIQAAASRLRK